MSDALNAGAVGTRLKDFQSLAQAIFLLSCLKIKRYEEGNRLLLGAPSYACATINGRISVNFFFAVLWASVLFCWIMYGPLEVDAFLSFFMVCTLLIFIYRYLL